MAIPDFPALPDVFRTPNLLNEFHIADYEEEVADWEDQCPQSPETVEAYRQFGLAIERLKQRLPDDDDDAPPPAPR